jgi:hypothetical protein
MWCYLDAHFFFSWVYICFSYFCCACVDAVHGFCCWLGCIYYALVQSCLYIYINCVPVVEFFLVVILNWWAFCCGKNWCGTGATALWSQWLWWLSKGTISPSEVLLEGPSTMTCFFFCPSVSTGGRNLSHVCMLCQRTLAWSVWYIINQAVGDVICLKTFFDCVHIFIHYSLGQTSRTLITVNWCHLSSWKSSAWVRSLFQL